MSALVPELVSMASDPRVLTADLLRRALVVARRLNVPEFVDWINSELTGYRSGEVPDYRRVRGRFVVEHPQRGSIPFHLPPELTYLVEDFSMRQSVPELAHLMESDQAIYSQFPPEMEHDLIRMTRAHLGVAMRPLLEFSTVQLRGVVETVRNRILDLALELEGRGILGEGQTFTQRELREVKAQHIHFGTVSGSLVQIDSHGATQTQANTVKGVDVEEVRELVRALDAALSQQNIRGDVADELSAELATLRAQAASPKPKWDVIRATARTIKTVAEGAAGGILAELAKPHVATLLALAAGAAGG